MYFKQKTSGKEDQQGEKRLPQDWPVITYGASRGEVVICGLGSYRFTEIYLGWALLG